MTQKSKKVCVTIEARLGSSRLPGKVMKKVTDDMVMIELMIHRIRSCKNVDDIIVATTENIKDDKLCEFLNSIGVNYHRGSEENVLERVLHAAEENEADIIVELCGDCPLIDPQLIDKMIEKFLESDCDYLANTTIMSDYPRGSDIQVFFTTGLRKAYEMTTDPDDLENVSLYIYNNPELYSLMKMSPPDRPLDSKMRLTVDFQEDLDLISEIVSSIGKDCSLYEISDFLKDNPQIREINQLVESSFINDVNRYG